MHSNNILNKVEYKAGRAECLYLDAFQRGRSHVEEHSIEDGHGDELRTEETPRHEDRGDTKA